MGIWQRPLVGWSPHPGSLVRVGQKAKHRVPGVPSTLWSQEWCEGFHRAIGPMTEPCPDVKSRVASKCMLWTLLSILEYLGCPRTLEMFIFLTSGWSETLYQHVSKLYDKVPGFLWSAYVWKWWSKRQRRRKWPHCRELWFAYVCAFLVYWFTNNIGS